MVHKHSIRKIRRKFAYVGLLFCSLIARIIRERDIYLCAWVISKIAYRLAGKQRSTALENLRIAFAGNKSRPESTEIIKSCFLSMAKSGLEIFYYIEHPEKMKTKIFFEGRHNLDNVLAKGKGVIVVSAHLGNFSLEQLFLVQYGYKNNGLIRHMRDPSADRYFLKKRDQLGMKTIYTEPRHKCVRESLQSLKNNEILFIMLDQNFGTGGVFVDFFGTKAATATGPIVLALRSKAGVLPMFMIRNNDDTHRLIVEPQINIEEKETHEDTVLFNVQKITTLFEEYIRKYPAEWGGWIHKRWKTKPK